MFILRYGVSDQRTAIIPESNQSRPSVAATVVLRAMQHTDVNLTLKSIGVDSLCILFIPVLCSSMFVYVHLCSETQMFIGAILVSRPCGLQFVHRFYRSSNHDLLVF